MLQQAAYKENLKYLKVIDEHFPNIEFMNILNIAKRNCVTVVGHCY